MTTTVDPSTAAAVGAAPHPEILAQAERLAAQPYPVNISWDEDYWAVELPDLPYLAAAAERWEDLPQKITDAKISYFLGLLEAGQPLPPPPSAIEDGQVSGQLRLRLPKSLHRQATRAAQRDGVSLNTWLVAAIAREIGHR